MAFFRHQDGSTYFGLFNFQDGERAYTGGFHCMSARRARILERMYRLTAAFVLLALPLELLLWALGPQLPGAWSETALVFFLAADAVAIVPAAILVACQPRKQVVRCPLQLDLRASLPVYLAVTLLPICFGVAVLWAAALDPANTISHLAAWLTFLSLISAAAAFRLWRLRTS